MKRTTRQKVAFILLLSFVLEIIIPFLVQDPIAAALNEMRAAPSSRVLTVSKTSTDTPGYRWCQRFNSEWITDSTIDGSRTAKDAGGQPEKTWVRTSVNLATPQTGWIDPSSNKVFSVDQVNNPKPSAVAMANNADPNIQGSPSIDSKLNKVVIAGNSGKGVYGKADSSICGGRPGYNYPFPVTVTWSGTVPVSLEISPPEKTLSVGENVNLRVVAAWGYKSGTKKFELDASRLVWSSDAAAKVPVQNGQVSGVASTGSGYATINAYWPDHDMSVSARIKVVDDGGPTGDFDPVPAKIAFGESFELVPKNINIPAGKTLRSITYKIFDPSRTQSKTYSIGTASNISIDASKYPAFIKDEEQTYPIDMFVTDSSGRNSRTVTKNLTVAKKGSAVGDVTGDFDIVPGSIKYKESFAFKPRDFKFTGGCEYISHRYKIDYNGWEIHTSPTYNQSSSNSYSYSSYPANIGIGSHLVYLQITSTCGETDWIGPKTLDVAMVGDNSPPVIQIGWVRPYDRTTPVDHAVVGEKLDLVYIENPDVPIPYDPDGDSIEYLGFDFSKSSSWAQSIPSKHSETVIGYLGVTMDEPGYHSAQASAKDPWGAIATARTGVQVFAPNPIPIIECPEEVTANHPVDQRYFRDRWSFSPKPGGRIDFSRSEWINRLPAYKSDSDEPTSVEVGLHVYDNYGDKSTEPAKCSIVVKPDLPPVAQLDVPPLAVRSEMAYIVNTSYSPDGDNIVAAKYKYKYDAKNNGFADDEWKELSSTDIKGIDFKPDRVGKYLFYTEVTEEYGRKGDTSAVPEGSLILEVVNNAPEVSFDLTGKNNQPDLNSSKVYSVEDMLTWPLYETNSTREMKFDKSRFWSERDGYLYSGEANNFGVSKTNQVNSYSWHIMNQSTYFKQHMELFDAGLGQNGVSPYLPIDVNQFQNAVLTRILHPTLKKAMEPKDLVVGSNYLYMTYKNDPTSSYDESYNFFIYDLKKMSSVKREQTQDPGAWFPNYYYSYESGENPIVMDFRRAANLPLDVIYNGKWHRFKDIAGFTVTEKYIFVSTEYYYKKDPDSWYDESSYRSIISVIDKATNKIINQKETRYLTLNTSYYMPGYDTPTWIEGWGNNQQLRTLNLDLTETTKPYQTISKNERIPASTPNFEEQYQKGDLAYGTSNKFYGLDGSSYAYEGYYWSGSQDNYWWDMFISRYNPQNERVWYTKVVGTFPSCNRGSTIDFDRTCISSIIVPDDVNGIIYAGTYDDNGFARNYKYSIHLDMKTGAILYQNRTSPTYTSNDNYYGMSPFLGKEPTYGTYFLDGSKAFYASDSRSVNIRGSDGKEVKRDAGEVIKLGSMYEWVNGGLQGVIIPIGDGIFMNAQPKMLTTSGGYSYEHEYTFFVGTPISDTSKMLYNTRTNGQFYGPAELSNAEFKFSASMANRDWDNRSFGFSYRMIDPANRYALEMTKDKVTLAKYVNGQRTELAAKAYPFQSSKNYNFRLKALNDEFEVFINNTPFMTAKDTTFSVGAFGYYSDKAFTYFGALSTKPVAANSVEWMDNYAIWEPEGAKAEVKYENINFDDPEKDPMAGKFQWTYNHTPMFLRNQGVSELHDQSFESSQMTFDKVGRYEVKLKAKDDPHPEYPMPSDVFDEYRKDSNEFVNQVIVHRRPISKFTLTQQADGRLIWNEQGYDPDRWLSPTEYSTDPTGIDYAKTRGIMETKYYYTSPTGKYVDAKLTAPQEVGVYEIGMAVRDEYGAWSPWHVVTLDNGKIVVDNPPTPGFTLSQTTTYRNVDVAITSTAHDKEDGGPENLDHKYYISNTKDNVESLMSTSRTTWFKSFNTLGTFKVRQVVRDSSNQTAETSKTIQVINRPPTPVIQTPGTSDQNRPEEIRVIDPMITWNYSDADQDPQTQFEVRIYKYGGVLAASSGVKNGMAFSWKAPSLQDKTDYYAVVRSFDGYDWGQSDPKFFRINLNRPPVADFDYSPKPVYEADRVTFRNLSTDPDGDPLTYSWSVTGPNGFTFSSTLKDPSVKLYTPGTYKVTLVASDGKETDKAEKSIIVLPLKITGKVKHTPKWEENRQKWNAYYPKDQRDESTFWAGEAFVLEAETEGPIERVKVVMDGGYSTFLTQGADKKTWTGELYDKRFNKLKDGPVTFTFYAYKDDVMKEDKVTVKIKGNYTEYYQDHRIK